MSEQIIEETASSSPSKNERQSSDDEKSKVSSTAIVKYVGELPILPYAKLRQDTDLNIAPANWLRDGRFSKTLDPEKGNPLNFSSFGIAHTFLDTIGDVDVISDAENIKKLLKMAYSKAELSLVVHRIGKTLLLDDLDLPSLVSYVSGQEVYPSDLRWLYEFYCEQRGIPKDSYFKKKKNKDDIKQKNIFSKFLHHSVQQDPHDHAAFSLTDQTSLSSDTASRYQSLDSNDLETTAGQPPKLTLQRDNTQIIPERSGEIQTTPNQPIQTNKSVQEIVDQEPGKSTQSPGRSTTKQSNSGDTDKHQPTSPPLSFTERFNYPSSSDTLEDDVLPEPHQMSTFQRNILWKFEDLHMLVGSNVPIFGGGKYPAVSLRLRDCGKPINVLTGLDYWLDNLMCNVPEVAMCYHLDGIVQYYDLFKTEELPQLEGSSFSPKVVKDIAQNVLSFMKSNCTQEGHTYWLFKASDSEVVKLYDLTSICDQKTDEKYQNPFTIPVAMLFYRVAKNMMKQDVLEAGDQSIIRLLLDNCVILLDDQTFPEIVTSANLLLSNLYSPDNIHTLPSLYNSNNASQEDLTTDHTQDNKEEPFDAMASKGSLEVRELSTPGMYQDDIRQVAKRITNNAEERCKKALSHIVEGLRCLKLGLSTDQEAEEMDDLTSQPDSSHGNQATNTKGAYSVRRITALEPSLSPSPSGHGPDERAKNPLILVKPVQWRLQSKTLILRKATSVCHSMACLSNTKGKYGRGLRFCKLSFECLQAYRACGMNKYDEDFELMRSIHCACADSYLMLAKCRENLEVHREDFLHRSADENVIAGVTREFVDENVETYNSRVEFKLDTKDNLVTSAEFYEAALDLTGKDTKEDEFFSLARRVGNVKNELGVYFMNQAAALVGHDTKLYKQRELWKRSFAYFESGIKAFDSIDDRANSALLYSNSGRLMRLCAQAVGGRLVTDKPSREEFSAEEKTFIKQSIEFYNRALQSLAERNVCPEVWDAVTWELSGAYFTMATLLQDYPPLSMLSQQEVEKEVTELMMKALKICEPTGKGTVATIRPNSTYELEKRIGSIHHRLASLYHNAYRNEVSDQAKKKVRTLAELHYTKACSYFRPDTFPCEWIRIHLERVAMCEHQFSFYNSGSNASLKTLDTAFDFILEAGKALVTLNENDKEKNDTSTDSMEDKTTQKKQGKETSLVSLRKLETEQYTKSGEKRDEITTTDNGSHYINELRILIPILEARLNFILKELVKFRNLKKSKLKATNAFELQKAKRMYSLVLRECIGKHEEDGISRGRVLRDVLSKLQVIKLETQSPN